MNRPPIEATQRWAKTWIALLRGDDAARATKESTQAIADLADYALALEARLAAMEQDRIAPDEIESLSAILRERDALRVRLAALTEAARPFAREFGRSLDFGAQLREMVGDLRVAATVTADNVRRLRAALAQE